MWKRLKTLEQIKSETYECVWKIDGISLYNSNGETGYISRKMYDLFGQKIEVRKLHEGSLYDYSLDNNKEDWSFCEEWFINDWFADEDFML